MARTAEKVRRSKASAAVASAIASKKSAAASATPLIVGKKRHFKRSTITARSIRRAQVKNHGLDVWVEPFIRAVRAKLAELSPTVPHRLSGSCKRPIVEIIQTRVLDYLINGSRMVNFRDAKKLTARDLEFADKFGRGSNFVHSLPA